MFIGKMCAYSIGGGTTGAQGARAALKFADSCACALHITAATSRDAERRSVVVV